MKWRMTALLVCMLYGSTLAGETDDWPMFQHDPQHSGYSFSPMPESPEEVWTNESHCNGNSGRVLHIAISEDRAFVINYACLSVLDVNSGSVMWSIQMPMVSANFPAIKNNRLFLSELSLLFCFNVDTGEELWKFHVRSLGFGSPLIAVDKFVIVGGGSWLHIFPGTPETVRDEAQARQYARRIMCLDSETGRIVWDFYLDSSASFSPAYFNGRVYTNDGSKHVYCLDMETGDLIWKREIEWNNSSHLSLDEERIFVGTSGGVICLESETGEILWRFECDDKISETLAVAYNKVFAGDREGVLYCLDAENGRLIWKKETGGISSPIIVADKKVAVGTDDGMLYIVKAESGKICESLDFGDNGIRGLALSDGKLFIGQKNGRVSCFEGTVQANLTPAVFILISAVLLIFMSIWFRRKRKSLNKSG